ncbi:MAG TPA: DUF1194 domain-containing protein [Candidatus Acidoferrum sp.]|nr:DUF1194 domain-containing protein [Candidatus Acidoferrum sp.]
MMAPGLIRRAFAAGTAALAVTLTTPLAADDTPVDLELVLAVDVSGSMDEGERALQRQGYVRAFLHPEVVAAITAGVYGRIAVTYVEWAGSRAQEVLIPWRALDGSASAEAFAATLRAAPTSHIHGTSISGALAFASTLFEGNGFAGARQAIDVSGDGPNNMGPPVEPARDAVVARGITINGLPLTLHAGWGAGYGGLEAGLLDLYYEDCVIGGPGAFFLSVKAPEQLADAIRRKLVLEIAGRAPVLLPAQFSQRPSRPDERGSPRIDCMIGEKTRPSWLNENR